VLESASDRTPLALPVVLTNFRIVMETMPAERTLDVNTETEDSAKGEAFREAVQKGLDDIATGRYVDIPHGGFGNFLKQLRQERKVHLMTPAA